MTIVTSMTKTTIDMMTFHVVLEVQWPTVSRMCSRVFGVSSWIFSGDGARGGGFGFEEMADARALEEIPEARREQPRAVRD